MDVTLVEAMFSAPLIGINRRWPRVMHAIEMDEIVRAWPRGSVSAPCGAQRLRAIAAPGGRLILWPPKIKGLPDTHERCSDCWEATGRKRPRSAYKDA